jgi:hypothetical protein
MDRAICRAGFRAPACRRGLISCGRRVGSMCTGCDVGGLSPDALCGG